MTAPDTDALAQLSSSPPDRSARCGLAICCVVLAFLVSPGIVVKLKGELGGAGLVYALGLEVGLLVLLAIAAVWPWTDRDGWRVLAVATTLVGVLGIWMALPEKWLGAPRGWHCVNLGVLWVVQCVISVVAVVLDLVLWLMRRRGQPVQPGTSACGEESC